MPTTTLRSKALAAVIVAIAAAMGGPAAGQSPSPTVGPGESPWPPHVARDAVQDDLFRLAIETPRTTWAVGEAIPITTTLTTIGRQPGTAVTSAGGDIVAFGIEQLDGPVDAGPGRRLSCVRESVTPGEVRTIPFAKSGGYDANDPMAPFWTAWFNDPQLRLPAGAYRIDAQAEYGPAGCVPSRTLTASVFIEVVDATLPSPSPTTPLPVSPPP